MIPGPGAEARSLHEVALFDKRLDSANGKCLCCVWQPGMGRVWAQVRRVLAVGAAVAAAGETVHVIRLNASVSLSRSISVRACAGLYNRKPSEIGAAYTVSDAADEAWLSDVAGAAGVEVSEATPESFLRDCLDTWATGVVLYDPERDLDKLPLALTLAGVLRAAPFPVGDPLAEARECLFNVSESLPSDLVNATEYVYERYGNSTTALAKVDPKVEVEPRRLTGSLDPSLVDYIVKEALFAFWLPDGCAPGPGRERPRGIPTDSRYPQRERSGT